MHKRVKKAGECRHCGRCCDPRCPYLKFIALRNIEEGEVLNPSRDFGEDKGNLKAVCEIWGTDLIWHHCNPIGRKKFPDHPKLRYPNCGYYFVDEEGKKLDVHCFSGNPEGA